MGRGNLLLFLCFISIKVKCKREDPRLVSMQEALRAQCGMLQLGAWNMRIRTRPGVCALVAPTFIVLPSLTSADCTKGSSVCTCSWFWPREAFLRTRVPEIEKRKAVLCLPSAAPPPAGLCFLPWDLDSHGSSPLLLPQQLLLGVVNLLCPPLNSLQFRFLSQQHLFPSEA